MKLLSVAQTMMDRKENLIDRRQPRSYNVIVANYPDRIAPGLLNEGKQFPVLPFSGPGSRKIIRHPFFLVENPVYPSG